MNKRLVIILFVLTVLSVFLVGCKKKEEPQNKEPEVIDVEDFTPESLEKLVSYSVLKNYKSIEKLYWNDDSDILIEESYGNNKDDGRFTVSIFSYKNRDAFSDSDYELNAEDYIGYLVNKKTMVIDGKTFTIGYSGMDDFDDVIGRAYVTNGDYVFLFSMSNGDDFITSKQYDDFISMIKTVKFSK